MDRATFQTICAIGALIYGVLYLAGVMAVSIATHNTMAEVLALATAGVTYLSFTAHLEHMPGLAGVLTCLTLACGVAAGVYLVW